VTVEASAVQLVAQGSPWAWAVVFGAGVVSSLGPCASPRVVALSALVLRSHRPVLVGSTFVLSLVSTYAGFGLAGTTVAELVRSASWVYGFIALAALVGGLVTLTGFSGGHGHAEAGEAGQANAFSVAVLSGIGFALMVSPCCTPIVGVIIGYTTVRGNAATGAGMLAVFGLGHAAPLLPVIAGGRSSASWLSGSRWMDLAQVGAGTCMIALGGYYALLV
jgi:cytochrome c-type biogenesis protein